MNHFQGSDRRRTERYGLPSDATVSSRSAVGVVNVGTRGIETETSERLVVGAEREVSFQWLGEQVAVRGTVAWSRLDRTERGHDGDLQPIYRSGIEAASVSIPTLERLVERMAGRGLA